MLKEIGTFDGKPLFEDPEAPPGMMYFINDNYQEFTRETKRWIGKKNWFGRLRYHYYRWRGWTQPAMYGMPELYARPPRRTGKLEEIK